MRGTCNEESVLRDDRQASLDSLVQLALRLGDSWRKRLVHVRVGSSRFFEMTVVDGRDPHPWNAFDDLVHDASRHEPGADQADANRSSFCCSGAKRCINEDHRSAPASIAMRDFSV